MVEVETNLDDFNPEFYQHTMDRLFEAGALDVFFTPIQMKKERPAVKLTVLVPPALLERVEEILFQETTTLGLRYVRKNRSCLERKKIAVSTLWGKISVKVGYYKGERVNVAPEYDDCRRAALEAGIPLKRVYQQAVEAAGQKLDTGYVQ